MTKYGITPLGLLSQAIGDDAARTAIDTLTLYMLRNVEPGCFIGMTVENGHLKFVQVNAEASQ